MRIKILGVFPSSSSFIVRYTYRVSVQRCYYKVRLSDARFLGHDNEWAVYNRSVVEVYSSVVVTSRYIGYTGIVPYGAKRIWKEARQTGGP